MIDLISAEIKASEDKLEMMTVPGVGASTAVRFLAALDEVSRFPNAHRVEAHLGLAPGENSSLLLTSTGGIVPSTRLPCSGRPLHTRNAPRGERTYERRRRITAAETVTQSARVAGDLHRIVLQGRRRHATNPI